MDLIRISAKSKQNYNQKLEKIEENRSGGSREDRGSDSGMNGGGNGSVSGSSIKPINTSIFDKIIHTLLCAIAFLVPIFFLPFTFEVFEFNKQVLLYVLVLGAFIVWVTKIIAQRKFTFVRTMLDIPVLVFVGIYVLASIFSVDKISSILGLYGRFNGAMLAVLAYALLYFVITNNVKKMKTIKCIVFSLLASGGVVAVFSLLQIFSVFILPFDFSKVKSFNLIGGSLTSVSIFLALLIPIAVSLLLAAQKIYIKALLAAFLGISFVLLIFIDSTASWIGLAASMVVLFAFILVRLEKVKSRLTSIIPVILVLAIVFLLIPTASIIKTGIPAEVTLSHKLSWSIANNTIKEKPLLGSGPDTFVYDFSKFKSQDFNNSLLWSLRFDKSSSEVMQVLSELGILGAVAYIALFLMFLWGAVKIFSKKEAFEVSNKVANEVLKEASNGVSKGTEADDSKTSWLLGLGILSAWFALLVSNFLYFNGTVLALCFWLFIALVMAMGVVKGEAKNISFSFESSPRVSLISSFVLMAVVILSVALFYFIGRIYVADVYYKNAQVLAVKEDTLERAAENFSQAVSLNSYRDMYHLGLSGVSLKQVNRDVSKAQKEEDLDKQRIQALVSVALSEGKKATDLNSRNVADWEALALIYKNARLYAKGANDWVIKSLEKAIELEPTNPVLYTELGKAYVMRSDEIMMAEYNKLSEEDKKANKEVKKTKEAEDAIVQAFNYFNKAVDLKQNYFDAHYSMGQLASREGQLDQAQNELEKAVALLPQNANATFDLGRVYFNNKRMDDAVTKFEETLKISPDHANALFSLGLVYEQKGEYDKALENYKKVLELNPNNEDLKARIDALEKGEKTKELVE